MNTKAKQFFISSILFFKVLVFFRVATITKKLKTIMMLFPQVLTKLSEILKALG